MTVLTLSKAINEGLRKSLEADPKVLIMGEDVGKLGGVFRVTDGLQKDFGEHRVVDTCLLYTSPSRWSGRAASRCTSGRPASGSPESGWTATTCSPAWR